MHQDGIPGKWIPKDMAEEMDRLKKELADAEKALQTFYAGACPNCKQTMDQYFKKG